RETSRMRRNAASGTICSEFGQIAAICQRMPLAKASPISVLPGVYHSASTVERCAMYQDKITMCLTIGRRPDLLRQTLETLRGLPPLPVIAINDFRDEETNAVFREFYPEGLLLDPGRHLGHHGAVDAMY